MIKGLLKLVIGLMAFTMLARRFLHCRIRQEEKTDDDVSSDPWNR